MTIHRSNLLRLFRPHWSKSPNISPKGKRRSASGSRRMPRYIPVLGPVPELDPELLSRSKKKNPTQRRRETWSPHPNDLLRTRTLSPQRQLLGVDKLYSWRASTTHHHRHQILDGTRSFPRFRPDQRPRAPLRVGNSLRHQVHPPIANHPLSLNLSRQLRRAPRSPAGARGPRDGGSRGLVL